MKLSDFANNKMSTTFEAIIAIALLLAGFYFVFLAKDESASSVSVSETGDQLLSQNFLAFSQVVSQNNLSLDVRNLFQKQLLVSAEDFTQTIKESSIRGRSDPFSFFNGTR